MKRRRVIKVLAAESREAFERLGAVVVLDHFQTLRQARERARHLLTEDYRLTCEASERLGYAQVLVNEECEYDFFGEGK